MIDLHCHMLPGLDDGAADLSVSLKMARRSVEQGVTVVACTPHILPGLYHNSGPAIREATQQFQDALDQEGIPLRVVSGADVHMTPDFVGGLRSGHLLSIADTRYVLVEPPHHTAPPQLEDFFFNLMVAGYVPVLTHPERLSWVPSHYDAITRLVQAGVWMQITAGSFAGAFGRNALYWAQRMLDEGCVHIIATDAHDTDRRPPNLAAGRDRVAKRLDAIEVEHLMLTRPMGILNDQSPSGLPRPAGVAYGASGERRTRADEPEAARVPARGGDRPDRLRGLPQRLRQRFFG